MRRLRDYVLPYWRSYLFAVLCMIGAIVFELLSPQVIKILINDVFDGGDFSRFAWLLAALVLLGIGRAVCGYYKEFTFDKNSMSIGTQMRKDLFRHLQTLSMDYFDETNTGEIMARLKDDVDKVRDAFGMLGMLSVQITIFLVSILYCMFTLSPVLTILPLATMIIMGGMGFYLEKRFDKIYTDISEENAELTTVAEENLAGVRTVKAFARERHEVKKFKARNDHYYDLNMELTGLEAIFFPIYSFAGAALPVLCALLGGFLVIKGEMDLGSLAAYVEYSRNCTWPLDMIAELANEFSSAIASYKKLRGIADATSSLPLPEEAQEKESWNGNVEFDHVSLNLDGNQILEDVSFSLPKGKTIGIMGATGSGKSSIISLLQRFYDPSEGSIRMDGVDLREMSLSDVRSQSAVVMQDVFLFSDTIEENIRMGERDMAHADVRKFAHMAQASTFIEKMDEQYDTVIGERGVGLSGGQKQRISIARAISKHSPILVMDDATSALDMETEREIQRMLKGIPEVSKLIVAHRISAVRSADEILYLEEGRVAERGTHEELLAAKGLYYATFKAQYPSEEMEVV